MADFITPVFSGNKPSPACSKTATPKEPVKTGGSLFSSDSSIEPSGCSVLPPKDYSGPKFFELPKK